MLYITHITDKCYLSKNVIQNTPKNTHFFRRRFFCDAKQIEVFHRKTFFLFLFFACFLGFLNNTNFGFLLFIFTENVIRFLLIFSFSAKMFCKNNLLSKRKIVRIFSVFFVIFFYFPLFSLIFPYFSVFFR